MEQKKISFGFMKTKKMEKPVVEEKKDFIDCVEEKSIKIVGGDEAKENTPLVIPMKPNTLITAEKLKEIAEKVESALDEPEPTVKTEPDEEIKPENETLDQMAVRELLQDVKKEVKVETSLFTVPIPSKLIMDGQKESTLDDYESVPVQDFGLAMLRGMGWTPNKEQSKYKQPQLRPKGLGLGADKVISDNQKNKTKDSKDEELSIVKNSFVKITTGKYTGYYGKVVSLDEDNGRVMVDIAVKKETVSLSEFMMHPVTKSEYDKESKVINADTFEQYKRNERLPHQSKNREREGSSSKSNDLKNHKDERRSDENRREAHSANGRSRREKERQRSSSAEDMSRNGREKERQRSWSSNEDRSRSRRTEKERQRSTSSEDRSRNRMHKERHRSTSSNEDRSRNRRTEKGRQRSNSKDRSQNTRQKERHRSSSSSEDRSRNRKTEKDKQRSTSEDRSRSKRKERRSPSKKEKSKQRRKEKKKYSSNESLSSLSDSNKRNKKKDKRKTRISDSESSNDHRSKKNDGKRDIDKKRKGKKKRRDRDRSPNHRKYKK